MSLVIHVDPAPIPLAKYAKQTGQSPDSIVAKHRRGEFPPMRQIGTKWFILPIGLVLWQTEESNGDVPREEAGMGGELAAAGGEETVLPLEDRTRRRRRAKGSGQESVVKWSNPI